MEDITKYIAENMYIVAVALYVLGMMLKNTPKIADWLIPYILGVVGILFGMVIVGGYMGVLQGILCAGSAVYANQLIKQAIKQ